MTSNSSPDSVARAIMEILREPGLVMVMAHTWFPVSGRLISWSHAAIIMLSGEERAANKLAGALRNVMSLPECRTVTRGASAQPAELHMTEALQRGSFILATAFAEAASQAGEFSRQIVLPIGVANGEVAPVCCQVKAKSEAALDSVVEHLNRAALSLTAAGAFEPSDVSVKPPAANDHEFSRFMVRVLNPQQGL